MGRCPPISSPAGDTLAPLFVHRSEKKLQDLLTHPALQGGLAPLLAAMLVAELLLRARLSGLAIIAGFAATVYLTSDFGYEPLTSTRKLVWLGLAAAALAIPLSFVRRDWVRFLLVFAAANATVWLGWNILKQKEITQLLIWGGGGAVLVGWLTFWMDRLADSPARAGSAGLALGLGSGGAALFGASALLGQFGLALGAAAGGYLILVATTNTKLPSGRTFTLPLAMLSGMIAWLAALSAQLTWYALPVLALIPLAAHIPVSDKVSLWLQSLLLAAATLTCAAGAVYLSWHTAGAPPW